MNLDGINAKKGSIYQDNKYLKIQNSKFDNLSFKSDAGGVKIKTVISLIVNLRQVGNVEVNNSKLKNRYL